MADEITEVETTEETVEADVEETAEETTDDLEVTNEEETSEETKPEEETEEWESYETDKEFLAAKGIEGYDTLDEFIADHKKLKSAPPIERVPEQKKPVEEADKFSPLKATAPFMDAFDDWDKQGVFKSDADKSSYRSIARLGDAAFAPHAEATREALRGLVSEMQKSNSEMRRLQWSSFSHPMKSNFTSDQVFDAYRQHNFESLDQAVGFLTATNPALSKKALETARDQGTEQGRKIRLRTSMPKSKTPAPDKAYNYDKFLLPNGEWDQKGLSTIKDGGVKMLTAYAKEHKIKI